MEKLVFNDRNRVAGLPGELDRPIALLLEKEFEGSFRYSSSVEDWESAAEFIEDPLNLGWRSHELAASVGLAYIAGFWEARRVEKANLNTEGMLLQSSEKRE